MPALALAVAPGAAHAWPGSPESPARLAAVLSGLSAAGVAEVTPDGKSVTAAAPGVRFLAGPHGPPPPAALSSIHPPAYLAALAAIASPTKVADEDDVVEFTYAVPGTADAALEAAGAVCRVVDAVCGADGSTTGLALVRPPGHHAGPGSGPDLSASAAGGPPSSGGRAPSGFCFLSNVAVGAAHARAAHGRARPLVVDVDVHVGDGTQAALRGWGRGEGEDSGGALVIDTHEAGVWPFDTGDPSDVGPPGGPAVINLPLPPGSGDAAVRAAFAAVVEPAARRFAPDIVFLSLGFDGHAADPLGRLAWRSRTYGFVVSRLSSLAAELAGGRFVIVLEGGYSPAGLARGARAVGRALLGREPHGKGGGGGGGDGGSGGDGTDVDEDAEAGVAGAVEAALDDACARHGLGGEKR
jgi:acetoin utilization deacetylase AcuC-like enzyme